jgi:hypothetical protein
MCGKTNVCTDEGPKDKKRRKVMSFLEKLEALDKLHRRMRIAVVGHHYGVNRVTVHFTKKSHDKITECVKASVP